jgi:hypothetical protein
MVRTPGQGGGYGASLLWLLPGVFVSAIAVSYIICVATFRPSSAPATPVAASIMLLPPIEPRASVMTAGPPMLPFETNGPSLSAATSISTLTKTLQRPFHVEAGGYQDRGPAEVAARYLQRRGYAVHVVQGPPYTVRVGGFLDRATANRLATTLRSSGFNAVLSYP